MAQSLIKFEHVSKAFGDNHVLHDASLSIYQGEITTIIGKSGGGKSVLLKHIIGLLEPDEGTVLFRGIPLAKMKRKQRRNITRKFSYMFQGTALFDSMTVYDNVALPLRERTTLPEVEIQRRVRDKMDQLDLDNIDDRYPSLLSGGMKKRVALARALVTDPEIVLFDEPTTGLDPIRKNAVHSMIDDYQKKFGFTGIVVSHEIPDIFYFSQRIAMLHEGRILFEGTPAGIQESADPIIQQFIKGHESREDELTGMAHQLQGEERFKEEMARLQRHQISFSLVLLTLDNMDEINNHFGHIAGQTAIKTFATRVRQSMYITDISYRYDLNKIMVVLPDTNLDQAKMFCEKLSRDISRHEVLNGNGDKEFCISVGAGFAEAKKDSRLEDVIEQAKSIQKTFYEFNVC
jgi:phospholipid/cholesterol/gamma-HCH transport system ATP-binding protein